MSPLWTLLFAAAPAVAGSPASISEVLAAEGSFAFSDGSSVFTFRKDHTFELGPVGMSGRTVAGIWSDADGKMLVTGEWTWINGISGPGDIREMLLSVSYHGGDKTRAGMHDVYPVYSTIERLGPVDKDTFDARRRALPAM